MSARKPLTRFYAVRGEHREWARFWLTDDGCLTILSDFGNYGYWWWDIADSDFREFLIGCDNDYVMRKLADGRREFDGEATVKRIRDWIVRLRRDGDLSREDAAFEWNLVHPKPDALPWRSPDERGAFSCMTNEVEAHEWYQQTRLSDATELLEYSLPVQLQMFMQRLWPLFVEQLDAELDAEEETPIAPPVIAGEWIGVDLDKTLAVYSGEKQSLQIGAPVPKMLARVKAMLACGEDVRIFTARVDGGLVALASGEPAGEQYRDIPAIRAAIEAWCLEHVGKVLPITNVKDYGMKELWDDKAIGVIPNTGERTDGIQEKPCPSCGYMMLADLELDSLHGSEDPVWICQRCNMIASRDVAEAAG